MPFYDEGWCPARSPICVLPSKEADCQMLLYNYYFISVKVFHFG